MILQVQNWAELFITDWFNGICFHVTSVVQYIFNVYQYKYKEHATW